eukprot:gene28940-35273_t
MISRRKSYTAEFKLNAVRYAMRLNEETGREYGNCAAGRFFSVDKSMISRWRKDKDVLAGSERNRRAQRHGTVKWPQLETRLKDWVQQQRANKHQISTVRIRLEAKRMALELGLFDFRGGIAWCFKFMKREKLSVRAVTSVGQHIPQNHAQLISNFRSFVLDGMVGVQLKNLGNMDKVPVSFDMPRKYTVDLRGAQDIAVN